jgi:hypothetical protein
MLLSDGNRVWEEVECGKGGLVGVWERCCFNVSGRGSIGAEEAASSMLRLSHTWLGAPWG